MSELSDGSFTSDGLTAIQRRGILLGLTASSGLGLVASTIYVPSVPAIAHGLHTSLGRVQLTFAAYLLAFAVSMLVLGPLSDRFGRRRTVLGGLALGAVASLVCAVSPNIQILITARVLQGIGACAGFVVGRALTREIWGAAAAAQVIAGRAIATTLMQAGAPVLGGVLQAWVGWRANFAAVAVLACLAIISMICFMPDHGRVAREAAAGPPILASYRALLTTRRFIAYAFAAAGAHAGFHIFAAGGPAVLIGKFGVAPEKYGLYAALPPLGFLVGSFLSNRLSNRLGVNGMIAIGAMVLIPAGLLMLTLALLHISGPFVIVGPMIAVCCGSGLITPNAAAGSLGSDPRVVGAASGLGSFIQMTGAASATAALSLGPSGSPVVLALIIAFAGLFCVTSFGSLMQSRPVAARAGARAPI
ncbi:MAG TPA: Bcr/CflA family efflux MFS transporter [Stellaceae bacterium]|nr:Bcr/CflA family efflux MFS transporter [Stellaceae bacterium]